MPTPGTLHPITKLRLNQSPPLTTREFAKRIGIDRTTLIKLEHGDRDRLSYDNNQAVRRAFPEWDVEAAMKWSWSGRTKPAHVPQPERPLPPAKPRPTSKPAHS